MKKLILPALVLAAALILFALPSILQTWSLSGGPEIKVLLAYNPSFLKKNPQILAAYESVLQEEGVPFESVDIYQLVANRADTVVKHVPAVILPDSLVQNIPAQFNQWVREYLAAGGNLLVVYDAGVKHQTDIFLDTSALSDITGLDTIADVKAKPQSSDTGHVVFSSEAAREYLQFPAGKTVDSLALSSYSYEKLNYPLARSRPVKAIPEKNIFAYGMTADKEKFPVIVRTDHGKGTVLFIGFPLGLLKASSDDLPLRAVLRTFLFTITGIPHIMNVENGLGSIVINWHIDSNVEHQVWPRMKKMGLLRAGVPASFHITAGDFCDHPGDNAGFDACGSAIGRRLTKLMARYGAIGSHGGWAHNWFAKNLEEGFFSEAEIRQYIQKNTACLESIIGKKIVEYSAPVGVHPQPITTRILEDMGFNSYYSTGDAGSAPNRTFYNGAMITNNVIAFPIMPYGKSASLYEMRTQDKRPEQAVKKWFLDVLAYVDQNRTVRLVYSHPYNIELYPNAVRAFLDRVETLQKQKKIAAHTMGDYAAFFLRLLKTTYSFNREADQLVITLKNPEGLGGICVALPKKMYRKPMIKETTLEEDGGYYYLTMSLNDREQSFTVDAL
jgi:hypothetical protein